MKQKLMRGRSGGDRRGWLPRGTRAFGASFVCGSLAAATFLLVLARTAVGAEPSRAGFPTASECALQEDGTPPPARTTHLIGAYAIRDVPECHLTWEGAGVMQGFPPPAGRRITPANMWAYPFNRWTLQNASRVMRTSPMALAHTAPRKLPEALDTSLASRQFTINGRTETLPAFAERSFTDALLVLRGGKVVLEWYGNGMNAAKPHYAASVTKSVTGLLAELLIAQGKLDPSRKVSAYVPELAKSPFGEATVRDVLDMKVNVGAGEIKAGVPDPIGARMWTALTLESRESVYDLLAEVKAEGPMDGAFHYTTLTTEVAGWILTRAAGRPYEQLAHDELWSKLGVEDDLFVVVDPAGKAGAGYGMNVSARDLAKLGQMIVDGGKVDGRQAFPKAVIDGLFAGGDKEAWRRGSFKELTSLDGYRSYWYQQVGGKVIIGLGVYGQMLYVDHERDLVLVKFASMPAHGVREYTAGWGEVGAQLFAK